MSLSTCVALSRLEGVLPMYIERSEEVQKWSSGRSCVPLANFLVRIGPQRNIFIALHNLKPMCYLSSYCPRFSPLMVDKSISQVLLTTIWESQFVCCRFGRRCATMPYQTQSKQAATNDVCPSQIFFTLLQIFPTRRDLRFSHPSHFRFCPPMLYKLISQLLSLSQFGCYRLFKKWCSCSTKSHQHQFKQLLLMYIHLQVSFFWYHYRLQSTESPPRVGLRFSHPGHFEFPLPCSNVWMLLNVIKVACAKDGLCPYKGQILVREREPTSDEIRWAWPLSLKWCWRGSIKAKFHKTAPRV